MNASTKRAKLAACTVGALTAVLALSASPASASGDYSGRAYVYGVDTPVDDWGDEGLLGYNHHELSNAVCFWEKILWAEGYLYDWEIEGAFDTVTYNATVLLQQRYGLSPDGVVGKKTFGRMDQKLKYVSGSYEPGHRVTLKFDGTDADFEVIRDEEGRYSFYDQEGNYRHAAYNYRNCSS